MCDLKLSLKEQHNLLKELEDRHTYLVQLLDHLPEDLYPRLPEIENALATTRQEITHLQRALTLPPKDWAVGESFLEEKAA